MLIAPVRPERSTGAAELDLSRLSELFVWLSRDLCPLDNSSEGGTVDKLS